MKNLSFTTDQIQRIYEASYTISESRGKNRQNIINSVVIESLIRTNLYNDCEFKTEVRIPGKNLLWGNYFPVDICIYRQGVLIEIILNKAPASSIKKNKINSLNSISSDIVRLSKLNNIGITLVNFLPKTTPVFKSCENIKCFEDNTHFFLSTSGAPYKFDVDEIYVTFEIDNLKSCKSKVDVRNLFYQNPIKNIIINEGNYKAII